jgi:hypothetical protein
VVSCSRGAVKSEKRHMPTTTSFSYKLLPPPWGCVVLRLACRRVRRASDCSAVFFAEAAGVCAKVADGPIALGPVAEGVAQPGHE